MSLIKPVQSIICVGVFACMCWPLRGASQDQELSMNKDLLGGAKQIYFLLNQLVNGQQLDISWTRRDRSSTQAAPDGSIFTRDYEINWQGSFNAYTIFISEILFKNSKLAGTNVSVLGKIDKQYWSTAVEKGMVELDNLNVNNQQIRASFALGELTNVLTMGFGIHWNIASIRFSESGRVFGKSVDLSEDLSGWVTYLSDGRIKDVFYPVNKYRKSFVLSYNYQDENTKFREFPSSITQSIAINMGAGKYLITTNLKSYDATYENIKISDIKPDVAKSLGVPDKNLYKYALISNGVTIPQHGPLTPVIFAGSMAKSTVESTWFSARFLLISIFLAINIVILTLFFVSFSKRRKS